MEQGWNLSYDGEHNQLVGYCQKAMILLDNRRGVDLRANSTIGNSDGKAGNDLLCLVDRWGLGLSL